MGIINIRAPAVSGELSSLRAGDIVAISGYIYTGRDAAHKRLVECIESGKELPVDLKGQFVYHVGPTPAKPGHASGSAGPTTSYRMDPYTPLLLELGVKGMIGKGERSEDVVSSMKKNGAVYLGATGGIAALLARTIVASRVLDYEDLGPEALRELEVRDMPLVVLIDSLGNSMYREGPAKYGKNGK